MKNTSVKLFVTGGHLAPAKAVIDEIRKSEPDWEIMFVGRAYEFEADRMPSRERAIMESSGVRFVSITTGRLQRSFSSHTVSSLVKFPVGIIQAVTLCHREKPDVIVSFGGYVALPVVLAAAILGIPVITHEQTLVTGLANRIIGSVAKKICLSFPDTDHSFPAEKTVVTGLPVREDLFQTGYVPEFARKRFADPLIYVTGGTTGSESLNDRIFPILPNLIPSYILVHQTGKLSYVKAIRMKESLPASQRSRYIIGEYFDEKTVGWLMRNAGAVVGRSGANIVWELAIFGTKAILVPLPWSGGGEQLRNARWLEKYGSARVIEQKDATPDLMFREIAAAVQSKPGKPVSGIATDGARKILKEIQSFLQT